MSDFQSDGKDSPSNETILLISDVPKPQRPILDRIGYIAATSLTFFLWILLTLFIKSVEIRFTASLDIIQSISGSSVELGGLTVAILALMLELNKVDKWFKLALLFVTFLFAVTVGSGYWLALTWVEEFGQLQDIRITFIVFLAVIAIIPIATESLVKRLMDK